jgi:hypothetical protein
MAFSPTVRSLTSILTQYTCHSARFIPSALFQAIRFPVPFLADEFGCCVTAFSTLSTPSTVVALTCRVTSLIWRDLASRRFWHAICLWRRVQSRD